MFLFCFVFVGTVLGVCVEVYAVDGTIFELFRSTTLADAADCLLPGRKDALGLSLSCSWHGVLLLLH